MIKSLDDSIKQFLLLQLYKEYDHILYSYRLKLKKPFIIIKENTSHYGSWCPKTRTLTLASKLVLNYSWDYTLSILKHEMAHQYVSETLKEDDGHGTLFKQACELLRVETWAQKACLDLDKCLEEESKKSHSSHQSKALRRVKKLLQLAQSSNQHEAFLALKKASEIAKNYELDLKEEEKSSLSKLTLKLERQKTHTYESLIASILNAHFNVTVIHSSLFNSKKLREEKTLEILGDEQSVQMAEYIFYFLRRSLQNLWEEHQKRENLSGLRLKNAFFFGVLDGYLDQLNQESRKEKAASQDSKKTALLIREKEKALREYTNYHFPRTSQTKTRSYAIGSEEYSEGFKKGRKLKIRDPLGQSSGIKLIGK